MINILEIGHATGLICCGSLCLATLEEAYQCGVYGNAEPSVIKMSNPTYVRVRELLIQQHGHMEMYGQLPRIHFRAAALEHIRELPDNILYFEQAEPSPSRKVGNYILNFPKKTKELKCNM